ncbi:hypothetical protein MSG28_003220 [Choristoneura fumiferana]|uniref:Uncharacterized protein n=1 Tax=Choristoneura fumiferana TaxID=7141 RepID=A0ACC0KDX7_CHOFU|nr:hypothetical protein MSG28_003220 [Choristoneura fumiferana]
MANETFGNLQLGKGREPSSADVMEAPPEVAVEESRLASRRLSLHAQTVFCNKRTPQTPCGHDLMTPTGSALRERFHQRRARIWCEKEKLIFYPKLPIPPIALLAILSMCMACVCSARTEQQHSTPCSNKLIYRPWAS